MVFEFFPYGIPSYVFSPKWFYGFDSIIDFIAIVVSILLVYYSYKCFRLTKENKYLYFSIAFLSITLGFISKIIGTLVIYRPTIQHTPIGLMISETIPSITAYGINAIALILNFFFTMLGFMILFLIISRLSWKNVRVLVLLAYFLLISTWFSIVHYQIFYMTSIVLVFLITYSYYNNHKEIKSENSKFVFIAFSIILVSQVFFVFVVYSYTIYVLAELIQLLGFVYLLIPFILIFKKKPKKLVK